MPNVHAAPSAVEVGFEPTEGLPPHTLSRRAPSATRRLHRRRAYPNPRVRGGMTFRREAATGVRPSRGEEVTQQGTALTGENPADDFGAVVQASVPQHVPERSHGPGLGIFGPVDQPGQPGRRHRPGAHRAWLEGDDERQPGQPPAAQSPGRLPDRDDLRMRGGVVVYLPAVAGPRYDRARLVEDDRTDRHVLRFGPGHPGPGQLRADPASAASASASRIAGSKVSVYPVTGQARHRARAPPRRRT